MPATPITTTRPQWSARSCIIEWAWSAAASAELVIRSLHPYWAATRIASGPLAHQSGILPIPWPIAPRSSRPRRSMPGSVRPTCASSTSAGCSARRGPVAPPTTPATSPVRSSSTSTAISWPPSARGATRSRRPPTSRSASRRRGSAPATRSSPTTTPAGRSRPACGGCSTTSVTNGSASSTVGSRPGSPPASRSRPIRPTRARAAGSRSATPGRT